jgi:hypothetical protein
MYQDIVSKGQLGLPTRPKSKGTVFASVTDMATEIIGKG